MEDIPSIFLYSKKNVHNYGVCAVLNSWDNCW